MKNSHFYKAQPFPLVNTDEVGTYTQIKKLS